MLVSKSGACKQVGSKHVSQCVTPLTTVITVAQYTKDFIVANMGVPADVITNVY